MDILLNILTRMQELNPSEFTVSLEKFYRKHGGLSKKQMEGLYARASKTEGVPAPWLATLEAIIRKKHSKQHSVAPSSIEEEKDLESAELIKNILAKYPAHKAILSIQTSLEKKGKLSLQEKDELKRFASILLK